MRQHTHQLNIKIPAGVDAGARLKLRGEGEAGPHGGSPGDLYVVLHVREHPLFVREGTDVVCEVPVSFAQVALGVEVQVPTLDGSATVKIPAGTQSGQLFRLKGRGIADLNGYGRGDQIVRIVVRRRASSRPGSASCSRSSLGSRGRRSTPCRRASSRR
jgi:molecular chaperone DnaJ